MLDHAGFALTQLDRLQGFFGRIESKSSFLFAVNLGLLGSTAATTLVGQLWSLHGACSAATGALLTFSMFNLYAAFYPHLRGAPQSSLLYFGDVSRLSAADFSAKVKTLTPEDLADDALCQVWRNSEILRKKFDRTRSAFILTGAAVPFWLVALMLTVAHDGKFPSFH